MVAFLVTRKGGGAAGGHGSSGGHSGSGSGSSSGGSKGSGGSSSYTPGPGNGYHAGGSAAAHPTTAIPWWAILLIVMGIVFIIVFITALMIYWQKEKKRVATSASAPPFRYRWVFLKALAFASGVGIFIFIFRKFGLCGGRKGGNYSKMEDGKSFEDEAWSAAPGPVNEPYGGAASVESRYEPMGYNPQGKQTPAPATGAAAEYYKPPPAGN